jgi:lipopolysaccharide/colanic/teichoic acid biosynthesis glycosyltransferase
LPLSNGREQRREGLAYRAASRSLDIAVSAIGLVIASPVLFAIAAAIRLTTPGPALFRQLRIGRGGRPFMMFKFRTMHHGNSDSEHRDYVTRMLAEEQRSDGSGDVYKLADDARITKVGKVLRRTSLDEYPQLVNVLVGQMSLVGPRPALPWEAELFDVRFWPRFGVKPGLTGLWQVSGRNAITMVEGLELDLEYLATRSFWGDVRIILQTIPAVLKSSATGRGVR